MRQVCTGLLTGQGTTQCKQTDGHANCGTGLLSRQEAKAEAELFPPCGLSIVEAMSAPRIQAWQLSSPSKGMGLGHGAWDVKYGQGLFCVLPAMVSVNRSDLLGSLIK